MVYIELLIAPVFLSQTEKQVLSIADEFNMKIINQSAMYYKKETIKYNVYFIKDKIRIEPESNYEPKRICIKV